MYCTSHSAIHSMQCYCLAPSSWSWNSTVKKSTSVFLELLQAVSVQLELQDLSVRTGLRDQSRLLLGPFSCSASLEARWCRHSGSPGPEPGHPKLLLDLKGGLLQVRSSVTRAVEFAAGCRGQGHISTSVLLKGISTKTEGLTGEGGRGMTPNRG